MKTSRKHQASGRVAGHLRAVDNSTEFHTYFSSQYLQRYADLFQALAQPVQHVALSNAFTDVNDCDELGMESYYRNGGITCLRFPQAPRSYPPPPRCPYTQLKQFYWLDLASVLPPLLLAPQPQHAVLDMCAAPGGKSLVLAQQLLEGSATQQQQQQSIGSKGLSDELLEKLAVDGNQQQQHMVEQQTQVQQQLRQKLPTLQQSHMAVETAAAVPAQPDSSCSSSNNSYSEAATGLGSSPAGVSRGRLVCNELDPVRRQRLGAVVNSYIPGSLRRHVRVVGHDAAKHWSVFESGMYDRVLLDAPCSNERHVIAAACEAGGVVSGSSWSVERCKQLAALQLKLLMAGLRALKPGGRLVYSTCSLADVENDQVVAKALQEAAAAGSSSSVACQVRAVPVNEWHMDSALEELVGGDRTQHGLLCLPDSKGSGPIYLAMLEKSLCSSVA